MSKKPIKRNENIIRLSKEHHFGLLFCWKIRQGLKAGITASRIAAYVQYFATYFLLPHFRDEEAILFVLPGDSLVTKAIKQHKEIGDQLATLPDTNDDNSRKQLQELARMVDDHIRFEERELFPHMEITLSNERLQAIGKQLNDERAITIKDEYEDEFWIKR